MDKKILLALLLLTSYMDVFGQSNDLLPELKSDPKLVYLLDSIRRVRIEIKKDVQITFNSRLAHNTQPPLFLLKTHPSIFILDSLEMLNPNWLQNIYVIDKQKLIKYGPGEKKGIVLITIHDKNYPQAYKVIKSTFKRFKIPLRCCREFSAA